jgi:redox-sensitive bicupin YhaK (pirin superfamily)
MSEKVHLLQIWILPDRAGHEPGYEQKSFPESEKRGRLRLIASKDGSDGSVKINQDAQLFATLLAPGEEVRHLLGAKRYAWVQVAKGEVNLNGQMLEQGDGAAVSDEKELTIKATKDAEVLLFDLA